MDNKDRLIKGLKVLSVFILAFIAIFSNVTLWNFAHDGYIHGFPVIVSVLNFIAEGLGIYFYQKAIGAFK